MAFTNSVTFPGYPWLWETCPQDLRLLPQVVSYSHLQSEHIHCGPQAQGLEESSYSSP